MDALGKAGENFTPETIHNALQIVNKRSWSMPIALGVCVAIALGFMLFGSIPVTGKGNALLMTRGTVIPFQATANGQIAKWHVQVGDVVKAGQLLAELKQPETSKKLEQAQQKLVELKGRNRVVSALENTYTELALKALDHRHEMLTSRVVVLEGEISENRTLIESNRGQSLKVLEQRRGDLKKSVDLAIKRASEFTSKLAEVAKLAKKKRRSLDDLLDAKKAASQADLRIADERLQLLRHYLNELKSGETYLNSQNQLTTRAEQLTDLRLDVAELQNQRTDLEKQRLESDLRRRMEVSDLERQITQNDRTLVESRQLISEHTGRVMELTAATGERVTKGARLGTVDTRDESRDEMEAVAYFKVKDGKRMKPGMTLRLTPATVQRERYGSLIAVVTGVSDLPVSVDGAAAVVGNAAVARELTKDGHVIQVFAKLQKDTANASGYEWDISHGPQYQVSTGTIADALANIEERPPLTFIVPILRNWQGFLGG
jgi:HlyD family secretion protein